jgi:DNA-binding MarR family transcriptional regulator
MANPTAGDDKRDWADLHVERWRDHWVLDAPFDDDTEAIFVRMGRILRHLKSVKEQAARQVGLRDFEYDTLHHLMVRETPGTASPTALAEDLGMSPAGMTGRLDTLEKAGWIRRAAIPDDRRRVVVEITTAGTTIWREAMALRGRAEHELASPLATSDRATLAELLRRMTLHLERSTGRGSPSSAADS